MLTKKFFVKQNFNLLICLKLLNPFRFLPFLFCLKSFSLAFSDCLARLKLSSFSSLMIHVEWPYLWRLNIRSILLTKPVVGSYLKHLFSYCWHKIWKKRIKSSNLYCLYSSGLMFSFLDTWSLLQYHIMMLAVLLFYSLIKTFLVPQFLFNLKIFSQTVYLQHHKHVKCFNVLCQK